MSILDELVSEAYNTYTHNSFDDFLRSLDFNKSTAVTVVTLDNQVTNGGFEQWYDNNYDVAFPFFKKSLSAMNSDTARQVLDLVDQAMCRCAYNELLPSSSETEEYEDCDDLDTSYYDLRERFLDEVEQFLQARMK